MKPKLPVIAAILTAALLLIAAIVFVRSTFFGGSYVDRMIQASDDATDADIDLHIRVLDENGRGLDGVEVTYEVWNFGKNWARSGRRGANFNRTQSTDGSGALQIREYGHAIFVTKVARPGYGWLYEKDFRYARNDFPYMSQGIRAGFRLRSHGQDESYRPDPSRPATFVMVKNGVMRVTTMPCAGGIGRLWDRNLPPAPFLPVWPDKPSIRGVHYESPTTQPSGTQ